MVSSSISSYRALWVAALFSASAAFTSTAYAGPRPKKAARISAKNVGSRPAMHLVFSRVSRGIQFDVKGKKGNALLSKLVEKAHWVSEVSLRPSQRDKHRALLKTRSLERSREGEVLEVAASLDLLSFGDKEGFEQAAVIAGPQPMVQNQYGQTLGGVLVKGHLKLQNPIRSVVEKSGGVYVAAKWNSGDGLPYFELRTPSPRTDDDIFLTMTSKATGRPATFFTDGDLKVNFGLEDLPGVEIDIGLTALERAADNIAPNSRVLRIDAYVTDDSIVD